MRKKKSSGRSSFWEIFQRRPKGSGIGIGPPLPANTCTRQQALESGDLIHVPCPGFKYHVAITAMVSHLIEAEKLWEFVLASGRGPYLDSWKSGWLFEFEGSLFKIECGLGDHAEPVITLMSAMEF